MPPRSRGFSLDLLRQAIFNHNGVPPSTTSLCISCQRALRPAPKPRLTCPNQWHSTSRPFTTTAAHLKKGGGGGSSKPSRGSQNSQSSDHDHVPDNKATASKDSEVVDPYDFSTLTAAIDQALSRLKNDLTKTRDAGRVTPEMIESLPVELHVSKVGAASKEKTRIGDIASVAPKGGRMMQVFCGEESHVKPITNAIQSSPHSLTPQPPDPSNALLLLIPIPPATAETRALAAAEAKKVAEKASMAIRTARGDAQKKFRKMELSKAVLVDELHKAHKAMEEVVKKAQDEAKRVGEAAGRALEG